MKRIIAAGIALLLLVTTLASCSAYNNPTKYVTIPEKGAVTISAAQISDKLAERIKEIREEGRDSLYEEVTDENATIQKGDSVAIYYAGKLKDESVQLTEDEINKLSNKPAEGEEGTPYDLVIGSGGFIGEYENEEHPEKNNKGFEDQLIGAKKGDKLTITCTFPDDYGTTALRGQIVDFEVEIVTISRNEIGDESTISVDYSFEAADAEGTEDKEGDSDAESGEDADTNEGTESGEGDDANENTEGDENADDDEADKFADSFVAGEFDINYTEDIAGSFNDIFKIADYAQLFKGKNVYYEETVTFTVPDDVDEKYKDFIGKEIKITFEVSKVTSLPDWDDEYVSDYTSKEYETVDAYNEYLENSIKQEMAYEAILGATVVDEYPMREVKKTYKTYVDTYISEQLDGASPSDFTASELKEKLTDEIYDSIYSQAATSAYAAVKERLTVEALIKALDISLSNKEYKEKRAEYYNEYQMYFAYYYGLSSEKDMEKYYGKDALELQFLTEKLYDVIVDYVTVAD